MCMEKKKRTQPCKCKVCVLTEAQKHMPVKCTPPHLRNLVEKKNLHLWVNTRGTALASSKCDCVHVGVGISVNSRTFSSFFIIWGKHTHTCAHCDYRSATKGLNPIRQEGTRTAAVPLKTLKRWLLKEKHTFSVTFRQKACCWDAVTVMLQGLCKYSSCLLCVVSLWSLTEFWLELFVKVEGFRWFAFVNI